MTIDESFSERLERLIFNVAIKKDNFWFSISFKSKEEAEKYRDLYPNIEMIISASYIYPKAEDAIKPQHLRLIK